MGIRTKFSSMGGSIVSKDINYHRFYTYNGSTSLTAAAFITADNIMIHKNNGSNTVRDPISDVIGCCCSNTDIIYVKSTGIVYMVKDNTSSSLSIINNALQSGESIIGISFSQGTTGYGGWNFTTSNYRLLYAPRNSNGSITSVNSESQLIGSYTSTANSGYRYLFSIKLSDGSIYFCNSPGDNPLFQASSPITNLPITSYI